MPVGPRLDQLRVDAHAVAGALDTSFQHMRDPELLPDLAQIACDPASVIHHRGAADYFQVRDSCEIGQNFVLHAIGEKRVCFLFAAILEGQNGDRFLWRCYGHFLTRPETLIGENCNHEQQDGGNQKIELSPGTARDRLIKIDLLRALDSFRRDLECPGQNQRNRESDHEQQHHQSHRPIWNLKKWEDLRRDLNQQPRHNRIRDRDLVNIAALQLGKEVTRVHFGFSSQSFWKRGSFRSGSNMGSSRSSAGVSGTFSASAPWAGIESSFCKAAIARSGSPICAATRAKNSIGRVPATASFSIDTAAMARSARANAAVLSPRPALVSARSPIRARFSACSLRKDSSSLRVCCQVSWAPA